MPEPTETAQTSEPISLLPKQSVSSLLPEPTKTKLTDDFDVSNASVMAGVAGDRVVNLSSEIARLEALAMNGNPTEVARQALQEHSDSTINEIISSVESAAVAGEQAADSRRTRELQELKSAYGAKVQSLQDSTSGDGSRLAGELIESISLADLSTTDVVAQQHVALRHVAEMLDSMSFMGGAADILGMIFVPDTKKDQLDFMESIGLPKTDYMEFAHWFKNADPKIRAEMMPAILEHHKLANDNNTLKASLRIFEFLEANDTIDAINKGFDAADWLLYLTGIGKFIRSGNTVRKALAVGNKSVAADLTQNALADGKVAEKLGIDQQIAQDNLHPLNFETHVPEAADGVSGELMARIQAEERAVVNQVELAMSQQKTVQTEFLTEAEEAAQARLWNDNLDATIEAAVDRFGRTVESAERIPVDSRSFKVRYNFAPGSTSGGAKPDAIEEVVQYTMDAVGNFNMEVVQGTTKGIGNIESKISSPGTWANRIFDDAVETSVILDNQSSIRLETLSPLWKSVYKSIKKKQLDRLNSVLVAGDEFTVSPTKKGKVFSIGELRAGIETPTGTVQLSDDEIVNYYKARTLFDAVFHIKNDEQYRLLNQQGYKATKITRQVEDEAGELTGVEKMALVKPGTPQAGDDMVWVDDLRGLVRRDDPRVIELQEKGYKWWRTDNALELDKKNNTYDLMLIAPDTLDPLPYNVLRKREGYVPKQRNSEFRFIRVYTPGTRNGKKLKFGERGSFRTIATSNSRRSADEWLASEAGQNALRSAGIKDERLLGPEGKGKWWDITKDEGTAADAGAFSADKFGGLIGTPRSRHEIVDITNDGRVPAHEAAERAIRSVSASSTQAEWRMAQQERWMNTAKSWLKPGAQFHDDMPLDLTKAEPGSPQYNALMSYRDWLKDVMRIPTAGEKLFQTKLEQFALRLEKQDVFNDGALKFVRGAMQRYAVQGDPASLLKSASFHSLLGFFNPAQLMVQASQAALAFSLNPTNAPAIMRRGLALRYGVHLVKGGAHDQALAKIAKGFGLPEDEYIAMVRAFDRSGMRQGITANADFASALQGNAIDAGTMKRALDKGLTFFYEGELVGRGYSFINAGMEHSKATGKAWKAFTDEDIVAITKRTLRDTLMMHRNNKAVFQRGLVGVPTQFWQVTTKAMEAILPIAFPGRNKRFTNAERSKIMMGQLALYGTAGVAGGDYIAQAAYNMFGVESGSMSEEEAALSNQGLVGLAQEVILGEQFATSTRMGVTTGVEDIYKTFFVDEVPLTETTFGAVYSVYERGGEAFKQVYATMVMELSPESADMMTSVEWRKVAERVATVTSTMNNAMKAYYIYQSGNVLLSNGRTLREATGGDWIGQAMGFTPKDVSLHYEMMLDDKKLAELRKEVGDAILANHALYYNNFDAPKSDAERRELWATTDYLLRALPPLEQQKVLATVKKNLFTNESEEDRNRLVNRLISYEGKPPQDSFSAPIQTMEY